MKLTGVLAVAAMALALPALGLAERPAQAGQAKAQGHADAVQARHAPAPGVEDRATRCPPGLATKSPACIPPGQARNGLVGRIVDWRDVHVVRKPGLYGLAQAPDGQDYAIVDGRLVRIDSGTAKVLSVIRTVDAILD